MNIEKQFWKLIYYYVKYFNFKIVHINENETEVWISNSKKREIMIFKFGVSSSQEIRFDKSRVQEHGEEIKSFLGYQPKTVIFNYLTDKIFTYENLNEIHPLKMKFNVMRNMKELVNSLPNVIISRLYARKDDKSSLYYKRILQSDNPLEKYMMKFAPVTYTLMAVNIIIWLFMFLIVNAFTNKSLLDWGALVHFNVVHGEWYRLVTSMFIHFNFEHILMNMLSLFIFGKLVEAIVGHWKMLGIYFISGIFGNLVSLAIDNNSISVGASGAIYGLMGALFAFMYISKKFNQKMLLQLIVVLIIMTLISLFMSNVNIFAHLGGFIGGIFSSFIGYYFYQNKQRFWIITAIFSILIVGLIIRIFMIQDENVYDKLIKNEMINGNYNKASELVDHTIKKGYADDYTYYLSGLIKATNDSKAEGISTWEKGLKYYPKSGILNYEVAIANRSLGDKKSALKHIKVAYKTNPKNEKYKYLKDELEKENESSNK